MTTEIGRRIDAALSKFATRLADAIEAEQARHASEADVPNLPWREERYRTIAQTLGVIVAALRAVAEPERKAKP